MLLIGARWSVDNPFFGVVNPAFLGPFSAVGCSLICRLDSIEPNLWLIINCVIKVCACVCVWVGGWMCVWLAGSSEGMQPAVCLLCIISSFFYSVAEILYFTIRRLTIGVTLIPASPGMYTTCRGAEEGKESTVLLSEWCLVESGSIFFWLQVKAAFFM